MPPPPSRPWRLAAAAAGLLGLAALVGCPGDGVPVDRPPVVMGTHHVRQVGFSRIASVQLKDGRAVAPRIEHTFPAPLQMRPYDLQTRLRLDADLVRDAPIVVQFWAEDARGHKQYTNWTEGQPVFGNPEYDAATRTLTLHYSPTRADEAAQGHTDAGFDPESGIQRIGLQFGVTGPEGGRRSGNIEIVDMQLKPRQTWYGPSAVHPLLRADAGLPPRPAAPIPIAQLKTGVSRYIQYGDLHRFNQVRTETEQVLAAQQRAGLHAFRLMGGIDVRQRAAPGPDEFQAMREYLDLAAAHGQTDHIVTLFDGAIPNGTLRDAIRDETARKTFIDSWRPFVREFGNRPVTWDIVNEIHGVGGVTERQRQDFVDDMVRMFVEEAPGARVTVGVANVQDLAYWSYLPARFAGQPVKFVMTFHVYHAIDNLPNAWDLNIPDGVDVGITEMDPRADMRKTLQTAADRGYTWLLFWHDSRLPYDPAAHRAALDGLQ